MWITMSLKSSLAIPGTGAYLDLVGVIPRRPVATGEPIMTMLAKSFYSPARGGHSPGDLRDVFLYGLEAWMAERGRPCDPMVEFRDQEVPLSQICGLLWNCHDVMPGIDFDEIAGNFDDPPQSRSYGAMARWIKPRLATA
jgi:hypothetical protein